MRRYKQVSWGGVQARVQEFVRGGGPKSERLFFFFFAFQFFRGGGAQLRR